MNRQTNLIRWLLVLCFVLACNAPNVNDALDTACDLQGCISLSKFSSNLDAALKNQVVGYVSTVGSLAIISSSGFARTSADSATFNAADTWRRAVWLDVEPLQSHRDWNVHIVGVRAKPALALRSPPPGP